MRRRSTFLHPNGANTKTGCSLIFENFHGSILPFPDGGCPESGCFGPVLCYIDSQRGCSKKVISSHDLSGSVDLRTGHDHSDRRHERFVAQVDRFGIVYLNNAVTDPLNPGLVVSFHHIEVCTTQVTFSL